MLTTEHIKEGLSKSYVAAITHKAGLNYEDKSGFDYGIDGSIGDIRILSTGRRHDSGFKIDFQLKSSINISVRDDKIIYTLEAKNFNDLVCDDVGTPRILILFYLPQEEAEWVKVTEENLIMKNCAWWCSLRGQEPTDNTSSVTIHIPRNQVLTVEELTRLMSLVKEGQSL